MQDSWKSLDARAFVNHTARMPPQSPLPLPQNGSSDLLADQLADFVTKLLENPYSAPTSIGNLLSGSLYLQ